MSKVRDNYLAEIIIVLVITVMLISSCGSTYTCPSYASSSVMKHGVSPKYLQLNECCIKTSNEVYKYEGMYTN